MLRVQNIDSGTVIFLTAGDYTWGRSNQSDVIVRNETVSRKHARVWWESDNWWISDLGSTNGTFLDRAPLTEACRITESVQVQLGNILFELSPWDRDDVLPKQVASPPLTIDLGEKTHSLDHGEISQVKTELSFLDMFMNMESPEDFYHSDLPLMFTRLGISGFGVIVEWKDKPLLLFFHGELPSNLLENVEHLQDSLKSHLILEIPDTNSRWESIPVSYRKERLSYFVITPQHQFPEGLPFFLRSRLARLTELLYVINRTKSGKRAGTSKDNPNPQSNNDNLICLPEIQDGVLLASNISREMVETARRIAPESAGVIVEGETGVGKEIVAAIIHHFSGRKGPFLPVMTSSLPENLVENELFGHKKGAYSDAVSTEEGKFAAAEGGTIFLDEVADMPTSVQAKLLRVLESGEIFPIGATHAQRVNVRIITASNIPFSKLLESGRLRRDLYHRLKTFTVYVPPLRERRQEILPLFEFFLSRAAKKKNKTFAGFSPKVVRLLLNYPWPGNVRELRNEADRVALMMKPSGVVHAETLNEEIRALGTADMSVEVPGSGTTMQEQVDQLQRRLVPAALEECGGNKTRAAEKLGLSRKGLTKMIQRLGLEEK
ncbi:MAG TPA: FHA domain-containing protein [Candidatus Aminicenantes bacterium]|nr:FHA domain-containing protein [Candidatus Aminicenantes bacterium]